MSNPNAENICDVDCPFDLGKDHRVKDHPKLIDFVSEVLDACRERPCSVCGDTGDTLPCVTCDKLVCGEHRDGALNCLRHATNWDEYEKSQTKRNLKSWQALPPIDQLTTAAQECAHWNRMYRELLSDMVIDSRKEKS